MSGKHPGTRGLAMIATLAALCASLSPVTAHADSNTKFTFYGKLYPEVEGYQYKGSSKVGESVSTLSTPALGTENYSGGAFDSSNSRVGIRGLTKISDHLEISFQLESTVAIDSGIKSTSFWNRDTYIGLAGDFGKLKAGLLNTVYKNLGSGLGFLGVDSGNFVSISNILAKQGFGTSSASSFHVRRGNSLYYESPEYAGLQGLVEYSVGEKTGPDSAEPWLASYGVKYEYDAFYISIAQEIHNDFFGGSLNMPTAAQRSTTDKSSTDKSTRLTLKYSFPTKTRVAVNYAHTTFAEHGGADGDFSHYRHNSYALIADQKIGPWTLAAQYGGAEKGSCSLVGNATCDTDGLDGKLVSAGAAYSLAKGISIFALYSKLINGHSAVYSTTRDEPAGTPGADIQQIALGISYAF